MKKIFNAKRLADALQAARIQGAVPEPASWAMMVGGCGRIGGAVRSPRKTTIRSA